MDLNTNAIVDEYYERVSETAQMIVDLITDFQNAHKNGNPEAASYESEDQFTEVADQQIDCDAPDCVDTYCCTLIASRNWTAGEGECSSDMDFDDQLRIRAYVAWREDVSVEVGKKNVNLSDPMVHHDECECDECDPPHDADCDCEECIKPACEPNCDCYECTERKDKAIVISKGEEKADVDDDVAEIHAVTSTFAPKIVDKNDKADWY